MSAFVDSIARDRDDVGRRRVASLPAPALVERLDTLHREGLTHFGERGLPTRRDERFKGTKVAAFESLAFARIGPGASTPSDFEGDERVQAFAPDLIVVDGRVASVGARRAELPEGVRILSLAEAASENPDVVLRELGSLVDTKEDAFAALNTALFEDACVIELAPRARPGRALRVLQVSTADDTTNAAGGAACFPRLLFVAGESSEGMVVVEHVGLGTAPGFTSMVSEFRLAADAKIVSVELQSAPADRTHVSQTFAALDRDARFASHVLSLGTGLQRSEVTARMEAPGGMTQLHGLFLGRDQGHHDHFTTVDHAAPHCQSDEEYRGVLGDASKGVFRGRVIVRPDAQKTDARQSNPNLLLSERATVDTKPQLEIYADDVKASHGSTIGQLDADALFFLRARGIDEVEARRLLTRGFVERIIDGLADPDTRTLVAERVEAALAALSPERSARPGEVSE